MTPLAAPPPDLEDLTRQLAALLGQGDGPAALAVCCRILERDIGFAPGYHAAGLALELMGDEAAALVSHQHAIDIDPAYADPVAAMALLALRRQDDGAARACAEQALALDPAQPAAALALARLAVQEARPAEAIDRLARPGSSAAAAGRPRPPGPRRRPRRPGPQG
jgi:tetratricopeptide (TPR) repeat protein